jgi:hypothetical protein
VVRNADLAMSLKGRTLMDGVTGTTQPPPPLPTASAVSDKESGGSGPLSVIHTYNMPHQQQQMIKSAINNQQLPAYSGAAPVYRQEPGWPQAQQQKQYGGI